MLFKNFIFLWVAFLACVTYVSAALSLTNPVEGTVWNAGQSETVAWTGTSNTTVTIILRRGNPNALTTVATIGTNIDPSLLSVKYTVPDNIVSGNDYTVGIGTDPDFNYSHTFTINGVSNSSSTTTSSASATSASASASASASTSASDSASASTVTATSTLTDGSSTSTSATASTGSSQPKSGNAASNGSKPTNIPSSVSSRLEFPSLTSLCISAISLALSIALFLI